MIDIVAELPLICALVVLAGFGALAFFALVMYLREDEKEACAAPAIARAAYQARMAYAEQVHQAQVASQREDLFLESHWTCPHCGTLVGEKQDGCPGCGQRLTLEILKAQTLSETVPA
jgi:hypothetical protein